MYIQCLPARSAHEHCKIKLHFFTKTSKQLTHTFQMFTVRVSHTYIFCVSSVDVHLTEPIVRQHKVWGGVLSRLIIVLECLGVVLLYMERSCHLVAWLGSHGLIFRVVECMQAKMLHLLEILESHKETTSVSGDVKLHFVKMTCPPQLKLREYQCHHPVFTAETT